jgi:hypothetical protein
VKLGVAALGMALLAWGAALRWAGRPDAHRGLREALLSALGVASLFAWCNFFYFNYPGFVHANNVYHYYFGAKFFPELGYTRLYECTALADAQAGLRARVEARQMTDLETYDLVGTRTILADPLRCTSHFTPARWELFKRDLAWFRNQIADAEWEELQRDHGYNPAPTWGILGTLLAGRGAISADRLLALTLLDPALLLAMWGCVIWAFGWLPACVAAIYWGTNHPAEFAWIGGGYLREDWLVATVIGVCLLRRGYSTAAGALLAWGALLRVFPLLALAGVGSAAAWRMARTRSWRPDRETRRIALGVALAVAVALPLSSALAGGPGAWLGFARDMRLHVSAPSSNSVGLETLLSYSPAGRLAALEQQAGDPGSAWKQAREQNLAARRPLFAALAAAYLLLLALALSRQESWVAAVLGIGALPVLLNPSCYYTSVLLLFGLLWTRREAVGALLCALSVVLWLVAASWTEWDDIFTWSSAALVAFVFLASAAMLPARARPVA